MKDLVYSVSCLVFAASSAHAQTTPAPTGEIPPAHGSAHAQPATPADSAIPADPAAEVATKPAAREEPASPAEPAAPTAPIAAASVTEAEIDSFAKATVKLQQIKSDATIAADLKQAAMQAAVNEAGLDPAKYNAISKAAQADPTLRARVQTAMARYATPSSG